MNEPDYFTYFLDKPEIYKVSDPIKVQNKAFELLGEDAKIAFSPRKNKKYVIVDPNTNKYIHFGDIRFSDFTKHKDENRRQKYLLRATNIKGNWKNNPYSPNNLSIKILWDG